MNNFKILLVDDDRDALHATSGFLASQGLLVFTALDLGAALDILKTHECALILLDYQMPEMLGHDVATAIKQKYPLQQIAVYSGDMSREAVKMSFRAGAVDFIEKLSSPDELLLTIQKYCRRYEEVLRTVRTDRSSDEDFKTVKSVGMVGRSKKMVAASEKILKYAAHKDATVHITGESGTGKELAARALHNLSSRAQHPFVVINCGAIPADLIESELFGHQKGSFTGAINDKVGKFVQAHRGTIFLDEIGDLPLTSQTKLLRVLAEREVLPVGAKTSLRIDTRIVTATHKNIQSLKEQGLFREDLLFRIKVLEVDLPPLRERENDIDLLVAYFCDKFNLQYGFEKHFQQKTLRILKGYSWPGNIRELASQVEKHLIEGNGPIVRVEDLDLKLYETVPEDSTCMKLADFEKRQKRIKMDFVRSTIKDSCSKLLAAKSLGISPTQLQYLLYGRKKSTEPSEITP